MTETNLMFIHRYKTQIAVLIAITLWASAFVGIRAGLQHFSPEGLALLRYLIASACMAVIYFCLPNRSVMPFFDKLRLMGVGVLGIGVYNIALNYGELSLSSGLSSFLISQTPIFSAIFAIVFLKENGGVYHVTGFLVSLLGVTLIAMSEKTLIQWGAGFYAILLAMLASALYSVLQKPFLQRYSVIQAISYVIWGATLFLCLYFPSLHKDLSHITTQGVLIVAYLGIFPASVAYLAWGYGLSKMPTGKLVSYLYATPFITTLLGWLMLGEKPTLLSFTGGIIAIIGVALVNQSPAKEMCLQKA